MSDPMSDELFRNRIARALQELDLPEDDADIAAALDAIDAPPLGEEAIQRMLARTRQSIAATPVRPAITVSVNDRRTITHRPASQSRSQSHIAIIVACVCLLAALGMLFQQFRSSNTSNMAGSGMPRPRSGELIPAFQVSPADGAAQGAVEGLRRTAEGDTIVTGPRERRRITLPDGSILSINEQSQVQVTGFRKVKLLAGEVFVEVIPASLLKREASASHKDTAEQFVVETPNRSVTALGTKFVVKAQGPATNVVVTQGQVKVSGVEQTIPAGQELIADQTDAHSVELRPARRSAYVVDWVKDLMAVAGTVIPPSEHAGGTITVVDPQGQEMKLSLRKFHVDVHIEDGFARTTIDQTYFNHTWQQLEGTFRFPLPADASLSRLAMYVNGTLMEGGMVERDYGRNVFEQIRHTRRDPALLEWVDGSTFQMRVFPLEARQEKRILLSYTQRLPSDYGKSIYRFPSGHNLEGVREWTTHVQVKGGAGTKWYSPSHLLTARDDNGDLILDGRDEYAAMDRDLVVELGDDSKAAQVNGEPTWTAFEQDGFQYVMLRQRPELGGGFDAAKSPQRQPRHWIFVVENSADRNSILAGTQRQIVKVLLDNAEHSDQISIVRAGTQADLFRTKPVECSIENIEAAERFLQEVAPIGALDLEQALQAVQTQAQTGREPWVVHLGTGIPVLGERDQTTLLRMLPARSRYVGVAVGKRWSKSFMEAAAHHTGGHVTQINPDEAVAWRAFDLLSTLNAPRLTEIATQLPDGTPESTRFLLLTKGIAHGQELAAVTRVAKGQALPKSITITGKLNGQPYSQTLAIPAQPAEFAAKSGHLPRTWARLEIDRLVALGSVENKASIIELSKSMYVMSPFTSLLVLETEAMYEQFKVDRGRKDHWAMYAAPEKIAVVAETGLGNIAPIEAAKERLKLAQARARTAQANFDRSVAEKRPAADIKQLERLNRAEQADVRLMEAEIKSIERANEAAANPQRQAWESVIQRRSIWQVTYAQNSLAWSRPTIYWDDISDWSKRTRVLSSGGDELDLNFNIDISGNGIDAWDISGDRGGRPISVRYGIDRLMTAEGLDLRFSSRARQFGRMPLSKGASAMSNGIVRLNILDERPMYKFFGELELNQSLNGRYWFESNLPSAYYLSDDVQYFPATGGNLFGTHGLARNIGMSQLSELDVRAKWSGEQVSSFSGALPFFGVPTLSDDFDDFSVAMPGLLPQQQSLDSRGLIGNDWRFRQRGVDRYLAFEAAGVTSLMRRRGEFPIVVHPLAGIIRDLPGYAPGLQTWMPDRLAIVEQAATEKPRRGRIDAEARHLIEKARSQGWEQIRLVDGPKSQLFAQRHVTLVADGSGRFVLQREVGEGLKETAIADGTHLWHLYPEIGLGAKRTLSRFHQSSIQSLVPWYVPAAEDLNVEADLALVADRTIRITHIQRDEPAADKPATEIAVELVFAEEGRLNEIRVLDLSAGKTLARQTFASDGAVRLIGGDDKVIAELKYERVTTVPPNLVPATAGLVVLPLPYRSVTAVPVSLSVNLQTNAPDYLKLTDDEALQLLATYFASARANELMTFVEQRYTARGDHRIGLAVLMSSVYPQSPLVTNAASQHPDSALGRFLPQFAGFPSVGSLEGTLDAGEKAGPFLKNVCTAYNRYAKWTTDRAANRERPVADIAADLDVTMQFIRDCRSLDLAGRMMMTAQAALKRHDRMTPEFARKLNATAVAVADERGLPEFARQQRIEWLLTMGDEASVTTARELFSTHLVDAIGVDAIPDLSADVRTAFVKQSKTPENQPCAAWVEIVKRAASEWKGDHRSLGQIAIARRCVALSEPALAAEIYAMAVQGQDLGTNENLNLAALEYAKEAANWELAETCVQRVIGNEKLKKASQYWRDAADIAHHRQKFGDWVEYLDHASTLDFAALPKTVNLESFRQEYEKLFGQLEQRTEQLVDGKPSEKLEFARLVQRAASRWREIDDNDTSACHRTARMLTKLGLPAAAWNYWTSPLAETPDQAIVWQTFASAMNAEQRFNVADKAWSTAFECESTNPEILLQHAQFLIAQHQNERARDLLTRITSGTWQPRFEGIKSQAQSMLNGGVPFK